MGIPGVIGEALVSKSLKGARRDRPGGSLMLSKVNTHVEEPWGDSHWKKRGEMRR